MTDEALRLLNKIKVFSPYLSHILRQHPSLIGDLFDQEGWKEKKTVARLRNELKNRLAGVRDFQIFSQSLRHFKQEEILRIAAQDLGNRQRVSGITRCLSLLAQVCLEEAVSFAQDEQAGFSAVSPYSGLKAGFVVLGMGKLGGEELNFSSDIDLIFIYRPLPRSSLTPLEQRQHFQKVARKVVHAIGASMDGDHVFRVDMNLRPGGKDSDLVISFDSAVGYYQNESRTWERMALIKARPVAGNKNLGKTLLQELVSTIYRRFIDYTVLGEIRTMKKKILEETRIHLLQGDNIKLGPGGIREIEFIAQSLQMVFGGKIPALREKNTLRTLSRLKKSGILPLQEYRNLSQAYQYLRALEHRLQMVNQQQTHSLPRDQESLEHVAGVMPTRRSRPPTLKEFSNELERVRQGVRSAFDNLLLAQTGVSQDQIRNLLDPSFAPDDWPQKLRGLGFLQIDSIREIIQSWTKRLLTAPEREKLFLEKVFPLLIGLSLQTTNPDQSLSLADRFLRRVGGRTGILAMLLEKSSLAREIMDLFAQSLMLGRLFCQNPEMMDYLALQKALVQIPVKSRPEGVSPRRKKQQKDPLEDLSVLRRQKSEQFLGIALEELGGRITYTEATERLTDLADYQLKGTLSLAEEKLNQEVIHPFFSPLKTDTLLHPFCIFGLGKLGGKELGYLSDLDLVFVFSLRRPFIPEIESRSFPAKAKGDRKLITYHEYLVRLAQRLISYLSIPLQEGPGYSVDTRLRPSGSFGPLIVSLNSFYDYYRHQAHNWEKQALLKARIVAGHPLLADRLQTFIGTLLYQTPPAVEVGEEMAHYRKRMERERSGEDNGRINPKLGYGGIVDIEFIVQYLQWTNGFAVPELRKTDTLGVLKALKETGYLPEDSFLLLKEAYQFLGLLDHGLQLVFDRKEEPRTYDPEELRRLAELNVLGLGHSKLPGWDILAHYHKVRQNVRLLYNQILSVD